MLCLFFQIFCYLTIHYYSWILWQFDTQFRSLNIIMCLMAVSHACEQSHHVLTSKCRSPEKLMLNTLTLELSGEIYSSFLKWNMTNAEAITKFEFYGKGIWYFTIISHITRPQLHETSVIQLQIIQCLSVCLACKENAFFHQIKNQIRSNQFLFFHSEHHLITSGTQWYTKFLCM